MFTKTFVKTNVWNEHRPVTQKSEDRVFNVIGILLIGAAIVLTGMFIGWAVSNISTILVTLFLIGVFLLAVIPYWLGLTLIAATGVGIIAWIKSL